MLWFSNPKLQTRPPISGRVWKTPTLFVMFPIFERDARLDAGYPHALLHKKLRKEIESRGLAFTNLLPVYADENPDANTWRVNPSDPHPNAKAHALAARAIAREIRRTLRPRNDQGR